MNTDKTNKSVTERGVRLQNLRDFTVQIRRPADDTIVGTGVAVSTSGQVVTCAHVVRGAGVDPWDANGGQVDVYFPQARGGEEKARRATVAGCFLQYNDDAVLLQLTDGPAPLARSRSLSWVQRNSRKEILSVLTDTVPSETILPHALKGRFWVPSNLQLAATCRRIRCSYARARSPPE